MQRIRGLIDSWTSLFTNSNSRSTSIDLGQNLNLAQDGNYEQVRLQLSAELKRFFEQYSDPQYDLWKGGVAKGSVVRPAMFKGFYGESWAPETRILPAFAETRAD